MRIFYSFLLLATVSAHSQEQVVSESRDGNMTYGIGLGFVVSPGYHDFLNDYADLEWGGYGWLNLNAEARYHLNQRISFSLAYDNMMNFVFDSGYGEDFYNNLSVPSLNARFNFTEAERSPFAELGVGLPIPFTTASADVVDPKNNGPSLRAILGLPFGQSWEFTAGYHYIPVEVTYESDDWWWSEQQTEDYDWGGIRLNFQYKF